MAVTTESEAQSVPQEAIPSNCEISCNADGFYARRGKRRIIPEATKQEFNELPCRAHYICSENSQVYHSDCSVTA